MTHSRLVCNQREKFQCAECRKLTSSGCQLIGDGETKFVCKECFVRVRNRYPIKGASIKHLLPADYVFSREYDPTVSQSEAEEPEPTEDIGYIGELVPDGMGGWREPTEEELRTLREESAEPSTTPADEGESSITLRYRFTTDNKLQVFIPRRCRIDGTTYELVVMTDG